MSSTAPSGSPRITASAPCLRSTARGATVPWKPVATTRPAPLRAVPPRGKASLVVGALPAVEAARCEDDEVGAGGALGEPFRREVERLRVDDGDLVAGAAEDRGAVGELQRRPDAVVGGLDAALGIVPARLCEDHLHALPSVDAAGKPGPARRRRGPRRLLAAEELQPQARHRQKVVEHGLGDVDGRAEVLDPLDRDLVHAEALLVGQDQEFRVEEPLRVLDLRHEDFLGRAGEALEAALRVGEAGIEDRADEEVPSAREYLAVPAAGDRRAGDDARADDDLASPCAKSSIISGTALRLVERSTSMYETTSALDLIQVSRSALPRPFCARR